MATPGNPRIPDVKNVTGFIPTHAEIPCPSRNPFTKNIIAKLTIPRTRKFTAIFVPHFFIIVLISFLLFLIICPFIHTLFHSFIYFGIYRTRHRQFLPNAWRYKKTGPEFLFQTCFSYLITKS